MYKQNKRHLQPPLISNVRDLPQKHQLRLVNSWAGVFYRELFCRLNEKPFAVLYADIPSRPNVPVNVLIGLEILKSGFGWSDEELYDHYIFDVQVRYALGYHNLHEGDFDIRSLYNYRHRLSQYNLEHGINLLVEAFEDIADQQVVAFKVHTDKQRMDSTQVASDILDSSRLQLAAEALQRTYRMLSETDQASYADLLSPYLKDTAGQYVYQIKGKEQVLQHLSQIGQVMNRLVNELRSRYAQEPFFLVLERFFAENFRLEVEMVQPKENKELSSGSLQSLDDLEASYRQKGNRFYKGYVANVTETCNPENQVQLITKVQVAPNNVDDPTLLIEALPDLAERTQLKTLYTDGGFGSPQADQALIEHKVEQIQTAIRGTRLNPDKLHLSEYEICQDDQGAPTHITCPNGQTVGIFTTPSKKSLIAPFDPHICQACRFFLQGQCRGYLRKRSGKFQMDFTQDEVFAAQRRRRMLQNKQADNNLRVAIEATMRVLKHSFSAGKVPVRGLFRVTYMMVASAAMVNIHSIYRFLVKDKQRAKKGETRQISTISPEILAGFSYLLRFRPVYTVCSDLYRLHFHASVGKVLLFQ